MTIRTSRLALWSALIFGLHNSIRGGADISIKPQVQIQPFGPNPKPRNKKRKSKASKNTSLSWRERWNAWRRGWAPAGGGGRECARRREQIRKGMLGGCNDVRWSDATLAEHEALRVDQAQHSFIGIDRGSPNGDITAIARAHCAPDGKVVIDDIEFQPAGRDPSP